MGTALRDHNPCKGGGRERGCQWSPGPVTLTMREVLSLARVLGTWCQQRRL